MPRRVDQQERRERIAAALMRVAADQGLEGVSLRHVAAEAGVTSGMVQHYFPSKDAMMEFAMASAGARFEARMNEAVARCGDDPSARELVGALLATLLPLDEPGRADGRVALAFLAHAATRRAAAEDLGASNARLRRFIADQVRSAQSAGEGAPGTDPDSTATALFAMAEGLAVHLLAADLPTDAAIAALDAQLDGTFGPGPVSS